MQRQNLGGEWRKAETDGTENSIGNIDNVYQYLT